MAGCSAVLIVVLVASLTSALPHWRGHNHHGWRPWGRFGHHQHPELHNPQVLVPGDNLKDGRNSELSPQFSHHGFHHGGYRRHHWPHPSHRWGHHHMTNEDQKPEETQQPFEWPHRRHHHPGHGFPGDVPWHHGPGFHHRRHHWPHWSHWNNGQNGIEDNKEQINPGRNDEGSTTAKEIQETIANQQTNNEERKSPQAEDKPIESQQTNEENKTSENQQTDNVEHKPSEGDLKPIESQQTNEENKTSENQQTYNVEHKPSEGDLKPIESQQTNEENKTSEKLQTYIDHQPLEDNKPKGDLKTNGNNKESFDTKDNMALHLSIKCQTSNTDGKIVKLQNSFCHWTDEKFEKEDGPEETETICEERQIIPEVMMPDDEYFITGKFKTRIECRGRSPNPSSKDRDDAQTSPVTEENKHADKEIVNTNVKTQETLTAIEDKTDTDFNEAIKEIFDAINQNSNDTTGKEMQIILEHPKEDVFLLKRTDVTGDKTDFSGGEHSQKDKAKTTDANEDDVPKDDTESNSETLTRTDVQDKTQTTANIDDMAKKISDGLVDSISDTLKHEDVEGGKIQPAASNDDIPKEVSDDLIASNVDGQKAKDAQEEVSQILANNDDTTKEYTVDLNESNKDVQDEKTISNGDEVSDDLIETNVDGHKPKDAQEEISKTIANNDGIRKDVSDDTIESNVDGQKLKDELEEISKTIASNGGIGKDVSDDTIESISDTPKHTEVQEENPQTSANDDDIRKEVSDELIEPDKDGQDEKTETVTDIYDLRKEISDDLNESNTGNQNIHEEKIKNTDNIVEKDTDDLVESISHNPNDNSQGKVNTNISNTDDELRVKEDTYIRDLFDVIDAS